MFFLKITPVWTLLYTMQQHSVSQNIRGKKICILSVTILIKIIPRCFTVTPKITRRNKMLSAVSGEKELNYYYLFPPTQFAQPQTQAGVILKKKVAFCEILEDKRAK